ncbi:MAG: sigma 54-interacting transcriptional regulator [Planctomycetota bacterium]
MAAKHKLTPDDRAFLEELSWVIFVNPFNDERAELDARLAGDPSVARLSDKQRIERFMPVVAARLQSLVDRGAGKATDYAGEEAELVRYAWLVHDFHVWSDRFDELTQQQIARRDKPVTVDFVDELLGQLVGHGFAREEAVRFFELFYQLRRAWYLIDRGLVGRSPSMKRLREALWNSVFTHQIGMYDRFLWNRMEDFSTLLLGETGSGKGAAAAAIGRSGCIPLDVRRRQFEVSFTETFLSINLSQYPEGLIESELFGHRKGAFTGAVDDHQGVLARTHRHGALFLDEIGEVSVPVQIKLLQVLQQRTFSPVGSHQQERFDGRVIAATNQPIDRLRAEGRFRDDFFYRLSSDIITVPPLRQRLAEDEGELEDLVNLAVQRIVGQPSQEVTGVVLEALGRDVPADYPWPGNVRELEQATRRILLTGRYAAERSSSMEDEFQRIVEGVRTGSLTMEELGNGYCRLLYDRLGSYQEVARRTGLDRRTVKKYVVDDGDGS